MAMSPSRVTLEAKRGLRTRYFSIVATLTSVLFFLFSVPGFSFIYCPRSFAVYSQLCFSICLLYIICSIISNWLILYSILHTVWRIICYLNASLLLKLDILYEFSNRIKVVINKSLDA